MTVPEIFVVDVDDDRLVGLLAAVRAVAEEDARAADRRARSPRGAWSRSARRAGARRGRRPRSCRCRRPSVTRIATLPSASRSSRSRMTRLCTLSPSRPAIRAVVDREAHRQRRRVDRPRVQRRGAPTDRRWCWRRSPWSARRWRRCRPLRRSRRARARGRGTRRPWSRGLPRRHCRSTSSALIGMLTLELAALDPAGQDAAEERIAVEQRREHPERAVASTRGARNVADDRLEQRRQVARAHIVARARHSRRGRWRRASGNRAARHWPRG